MAEALRVAKAVLGLTLPLLEGEEEEAVVVVEAEVVEWACSRRMDNRLA